ncbi:MAG: iron transporter [Planctomycetota bacterium]|nr:MAG: iron transporter [Planctomycetota bacterium]
MTLDNMSKGESATITAINCGKELKSRLNSFGLVRGQTVEVEKRSLAKNTLEIIINNMHLAIRSTEAEKIEVSI